MPFAPSPSHQHFSRWYKPFPNGWFVALFYPHYSHTPIRNPHSVWEAHGDEGPLIVVWIPWNNIRITAPPLHKVHVAPREKPAVPAHLEKSRRITWQTIYKSQVISIFMAYFHHPVMVGGSQGATHYQGWGPPASAATPAASNLLWVACAHGRRIIPLRLGFVVASTLHDACPTKSLKATSECQHDLWIGKHSQSWIPPFFWSWYRYVICNWLVVSTPLKNMKVSWDYEIPNIWKNKSHVPNHQPDKDV